MTRRTPGRAAVAAASGSGQSTSMAAAGRRRRWPSRRPKAGAGRQRMVRTRCGPVPAPSRQNAKRASRAPVRTSDTASSACGWPTASRARCSVTPQPTSPRDARRSSGSSGAAGTFTHSAADGARPAAACAQPRGVSSSTKAPPLRSTSASYSLTARTRAVMSGRGAAASASRRAGSAKSCHTGTGATRSIPAAFAAQAIASAVTTSSVPAGTCGASAARQAGWQATTTRVTDEACSSRATRCASHGRPSIGVAASGASAHWVTVTIASTLTPRPPGRTPRCAPRPRRASRSARRATVRQPPSAAVAPDRRALRP